jgi:acyl dehydratase
VGDGNPRWQGKQAEAPPTMLATLGFERAVSSLLGPGTVVLHGSTDLEVHAPVRVGDTISVTAIIAAVRERQMSTVNTAFVTLQKTYVNQRGEKVAGCKQLAIIRQENVS